MTRPVVALKDSRVRVRVRHESYWSYWLSHHKEFKICPSHLTHCSLREQWAVPRPGIIGWSDPPSPQYSILHLKQGGNDHIYTPPPGRRSNPQPSNLTQATSIEIPLSLFQSFGQQLVPLLLASNWQLKQRLACLWALKLYDKLSTSFCVIVLIVNSCLGRYLGRVWQQLPFLDMHYRWTVPSDTWIFLWASVYFRQ